VFSDQPLPKPDPVARLKNFASGLFAGGVVLWLITGVIALAFPATPATSEHPASGVPLPMQNWLLALAVTLVVTSATCWISAGHRDWVMSCADMAEAKMEAQDEMLTATVEMGRAVSARADARDARLGDIMEALGRHSALLEQAAHRPRTRTPQGEVKANARTAVAGRDAALVLPPDVLDITKRLDRKIGGAN
jgi:hypothetical protein